MTVNFVDYYNHPRMVGAVSGSGIGIVLPLSLFCNSIILWHERKCRKFKVDGKIHAIKGKTSTDILGSPLKIKRFFPCYQVNIPYLASRKSLRFKCMVKCLLSANLRYFIGGEVTNTSDFLCSVITISKYSATCEELVA